MNDDMSQDERLFLAMADFIGANADAPELDEALLNDLSRNMTREDWAWLDIVRGLVRCPVHGRHCSLAEAVATANENVPAVSR